LSFSTDTTYKRRFTPSQFFEKNGKPLIVVNATFFSFQTNQNLNAVIKDHKLVSYNVHNVPGRGKDTFTYRHPLGSAIGITKNGKADVAWLYTDSTESHAMATQMPTIALKDSLPYLRKKNMKRSGRFKKWKVQTGIGGGPVLVQDGMIKITNNEELKFAGNAVNDRHPRTAMGYTKDNKLVIMVVQGRMPEIAEGVSLKHLAEMLRDVGCVEALNLDGGGSSCLLVNGKETIKPSDPNGQRPVPAVFLIKVSR
jgi:exopolysaccharide biosynthesis protein